MEIKILKYGNFKCLSVFKRAESRSGWKNGDWQRAFCGACTRFFARASILCAALLIEFMLVPAVYGSDSCDIEEMHEKYNENYSLCDELKEEEAGLDDDCLLKMNRLNLKWMLELLLVCGLYEEALPYIEKYREKPNAGYNEGFLLEAMYLDDEEKILEEGLKASKTGREGDRKRFFAFVYEQYGDFRKAIRILEEGLSKEPDLLRIVNDLCRLYLDAGDFEKSKKYAEYYLKGDTTWQVTYYRLAEINYYLGDYKAAWDFLNEGNEKNTSGFMGPFIEGRLLVTDGEYDKALRAFKQVKSRYPYIEINRNFKMEHDLADFYIELYEDEGGVPSVETLEERSNKYYESGDYHIAGMYDLLLSMIEPKQTSHFYDFAYMMELNGSLFLAARFYSLYLALTPDTDAKQDILKFLESRESAAGERETGCENYFEDDDCNSQTGKCYWNAADSSCYNRLSSCNTYHSIGACNGAPKEAGCYWNAGMESCIGRFIGCNYYKEEFTCREAPIEKGCYWNASESMCYDRLSSCNIYRSMDSCGEAPSVAECYWNAGLNSCMSRGKGCYYYKEEFACREAPMEHECVWDNSKGKCVYRRN